MNYFQVMQEATPILILIGMAWILGATIYRVVYK